MISISRARSLVRNSRSDVTHETNDEVLTEDLKEPKGIVRRTWVELAYTVSAKKVVKVIPAVSLISK